MTEHEQDRQDAQLDDGSVPGDADLRPVESEQEASGDEAGVKVEELTDDEADRELRHY